MSRLLPLLALLSFAAAAAAEDWPCWRGPRLDGTVLDDKVPLEWSKTDNVRWSVEVPGRGYSSPVVSGDRVLLTACDEDKLERKLICLDRKTGKTLWAETVLTSKLEKKHGLNSYASSTPATDGKHVYASFMGPDNTMQAVCYTLEGKKVWQIEPGFLKSVHGFCSSPVLHKGLVVLNGDQDAKAFVVALDRATGKEVWRADRPNKTRSYCTPILVPDPKREGVTQLVMSGSKCVTGYDADTGKLLWIHDGPTQQYVASLVPHQGILFLTTGFPEFHLMGIRPDGEGNITKTKHVAWHIPHKENQGGKGASYVPSPLAHDGHFYVVSDVGFLGCIEAQSGKRVYMKKLGRRHSASPVLIRGHLVVPDDDGKVFVVKAGPEFELVRTIDMGKTIYASPAVSQGQMFLRTLDRLYCIEAK